MENMFVRQTALGAMHSHEPIVVSEARMAGVSDITCTSEMVRVPHKRPEPESIHLGDFAPSKALISQFSNLLRWDMRSSGDEFNFS